MRGRRLTAIMAAGLLALAAAGCGSDDALAPEVPGPPADVVLPESTVAPAADENADSANQDSTTDEGTTDDTTAPDDTGSTGDTGDTGGATTPDTSGGGTAAPDAAADSPTNDTPPPADSEAEQFEDFCAQNPGAC